MMADPKILVSPEGREGVWLADRDSLVAWLGERPDEHLSNILQVTGVLLGANWPKRMVLEAVRHCSRAAVLTGAARAGNMGHALAVIGPHPKSPRGDEMLMMFDVGDIGETDFVLHPQVA